ncbi:hypothetical protein M0R45_009827 [Rubus argutus]|uniref:Pentatricopeptide repeat-containing protein n=1 Tax=Rubus argutus TaxID=59490 RepID=A0AAW1Y606_RUBAR
MAKARKLFDEMPERDVVSWNLMISGYISCRGSRYVEEGRMLFDRMPVRDCVSWNTMISGYAKNGRMVEALKLFDSMPERSVVSWNAMVTGFLQNGDVVRAIEFFERIPQRDGASLSALVSGLIQNGELDEAARIVHECGKRDEGMEDLVHAYNTLIAGYGQRGRVGEARRLFDQIPYCHEMGKEDSRRWGQYRTVEYGHRYRVQIRRLPQRNNLNCRSPNPVIDCNTIVKRSNVSGSIDSFAYLILFFVS